MTKEEIERFAATAKLATATAGFVNGQAKKLQILVEIVGQLIATCPGIAGERKEAVAGLLAQLRAEQAKFLSEGS